MGRRSSHAPGAFSWVDLSTTDVAAAKAFYVGLFGWEAEDDDADAGSPYTTCRIDGDAVCGIFEMSGDVRATGASSSWTSYVTVADADAAAARAEELGGGTIEPAADVLDAGRMAILEDPQGAVFAVWQPRTRIGAERVNDVGCLCMNELATSDVEAAASFYEGVFGWTSMKVEIEPDQQPIVMAQNGGRDNASLSRLEDRTAPHWRPYFTVESTEAGLERVRELGGTEVLGPTQIFDGSIAIALDPQGATFALFAGEVDP